MSNRQELWKCIRFHQPSFPFNYFSPSSTTSWRWRERLVQTGQGRYELAEAAQWPPYCNFLFGPFYVSLYEKTETHRKWPVTVLVHWNVLILIPSLDRVHKKGRWVLRFQQKKKAFPRSPWLDELFSVGVYLNKISILHLKSFFISFPNQPHLPSSSSAMCPLIIPL